MFTVQIRTVTEQPLRPGDVFFDAKGVIWVAINPDVRGPVEEREPLDASCIWHLPDATASRDDDVSVEIASLPQPFTLIIRLNEVTR